MSGFTNITGLSDPSTLPGFAGLLQTAFFRGVPFKVDAQRIKMGRRQAIHSYPFVDGGWAEDMGAALRTYSFTGHLIGDLAPVMQLALNTVLELKGPGLLIHPTVGAVQVAVLSAATSVHKDKMRVIAIDFEFVEAGSNSFPALIIATAVSVLLACGAALTAMNGDFATTAGPVAAIGPDVTAEGESVVAAFNDLIETRGEDPTAIVGLATALPPPDGYTYGRYGEGSATQRLPEGTTIASLQEELATLRQEIAVAGQAAETAAGSYSATTDIMSALAAPLEAMRAGIHDPADQVRILARLSIFRFNDTESGLGGLGAAKVVMREAMAGACRRAALVSQVRASAGYQPSSYNDAFRLRESLANALDVEIAAAGDAFEDDTFLALKRLRQAMVRDLTQRGGSLPSLVTVTFPTALPSLAIAQMLYQNASRSDEIAAEAVAIHPAFCPPSFEALSR